MMLAKQFREAHWEPTIGDPTVIGWVTVFCYAVAAVLCFACWRRHADCSDPQRSRRLGWFWLVVALGMSVLAVNKQLDLQALVHTIGRNTAIRNGWFDRRHEVMRYALIAVGVFGLLSVAGILWLMRGLWSRVRLVVAGLALLAGFAVLRTAELLEIENVTRVRLSETVQLSNLIELAVIALVSAGAWQGLRRRKTADQPASHRPA